MIPGVYWVLGTVAALALLAWAHLVFWRGRYRLPLPPDERLEVTARDGVRLALARLKPNPDGPGRGAPVICCHGLACNYRTFDLEPGRSLGRHLAGLGFDVFLVDLRGAGGSGRPAWWRFGFFDYVEKDAPAVIDFVRGLTGRSRVLWVGHSMGGLIGYEHLLRDDAHLDLAALVTIGSPLNLGGAVRRELNLSARAIRWLGWLSPVVHLGLISHFLAPFAGRLRGYPETIFVNPRQTPGPVLRHFMVNVLTDVSRRVLHELAVRILRDASADGRPLATVRDGLTRSPVPTLVLAGAGDHIAPVAACDVTVQRNGCDHEWKVLSRECGAPFDFGHLDLMVGDAAPACVYEPVARFLLERKDRCEP